MSPSQSSTEPETLREQIKWMVARCNEAMGDGFRGTPNSAVAAVCDELVQVRAELQQARAGMGVAVQVMTHEQIADWMTRLRRLENW